ncbi:putative 2OG-Fe(II) oxygenase family oxidoreductase [Purpureocillium lavendulum]|uniref:2OG-Fe(II) oxygenase family oxidoreductase n=1 Tax=Purpureocillium lavendulum TaxID=1247861 RepID=A0AB34FWZ4_9HYPO|nr:putative 2OG-Fe(II) oxygenase family oxidoreductase [Purpureocillium lavendulum]
MDQQAVQPLSLPEAHLSVIDWAKLKTGDNDEAKRLVEACEGRGFFYLDLRRDESFVQAHKDVLSFMNKYFHQDLATKMTDSRQSDTHGYEPVATSTGAVNALPDYYESLKASRDELVADSQALAPAIKAHRDLFMRFCGTAHDVCSTVLYELDRYLAFDERRRLANFHHDGVESLTTLSMFRYPKQDSIEAGVGHNKHTDIGTLTFLLCEQWGLQVLSKDPVGWAFVTPKPGHAVINVGDTLRFLSGNRFRSAVHRVIPTQGLQHEDRYSIAYFLRAGNDSQFTDSTGRFISAKEWHDEKFDVFRETHEQQASLPILTGGMERMESLVV